MVPDRWETVWRTLGPFGIFVHINSNRGSAFMHYWIIIVELGGLHRATSDTRAGALSDSHTVARNQILYDDGWI